LLAFGLAIGAASGALAQPIPEIEPVNSAPPGQPGVPGAPFWSAEGGLAPGDVDFYDHGPVVPFPPGAPVMITGATFTAPWFLVPATPAPASDTVIGAFGPAGIGAPISTDDDDGPGFNSSHSFTAPAGSPLFHGVTGFPDFGFVGAHGITAAFYRFVVSAGGAPEFEPNGTIPTANPMPPLIAGATANEGALVTGDVDYFFLPIAAGTFVTGSVYDFTPVGGPAMDTLLGVFDPGGLLLGFDDDEGPFFNSGLAFVAPATGVYTFAVSGFGDPDFDGIGHTAVGPYRLVVSVPAPGAISLLVLGGLIGARRRR
jgi:hypothetical protein